MADELDVIICGGGPVGMTLALLLQREGLRFRIVDKRAGPIDVTHACVLWGRTQELFADLGLLERLAPRAIPLERMALRMFGREVGAVDYIDPEGEVPRPLLIGQNVTERVLIEALAERGITIERNVEAIEYTERDGGVRVVLQSLSGEREEVDARYVAGCEGSASMVRERAGITSTGRRYDGYEFVQADCAVEYSRPKDEGFYCFSGGRFLGIVPLPLPIDAPKRIRVFIARPQADASDRSDPTLDDIEREMASIMREPVRLSQPIWLSRVRVQRRLATHYRQGRALLLGDAAHVHVPMGGQGMNCGMQDAYNLAWKLGAVVRDGAPESLLESYEAERRPIAEKLLASTERSFLTFIRQPLPFRLFAPLIAPVALARKAVQRRARRTLAQFAVAYRAVGLSEDRQSGASVVAGDRAPDAALEAPRGAAVRLHELLRGGRWSIILAARGAGGSGALRERIAALDLGDAGPRVLSIDGDDAESLRDVDGRFARRYGVAAPTFYAVRPDGYVGYSGPLAEFDAAAAYLTRYSASRSRERMRAL